MGYANLFSIGDTFHTKTTTKDSFLPDQTTHALAEQTNACLQDAVRRGGKAYVQHLDGFIVALREELDSSGGVTSKNPPAVERKPYRMDVKHDGTGIESQGWFRTSKDTKEVDEDSMMMSRLCALHWVIVLYESVVPDVLKADVSRNSCYLSSWILWIYISSCTPIFLSFSMHASLLSQLFISSYIIHPSRSFSKVSKSSRKLLYQRMEKAIFHGSILRARCQVLRQQILRGQLKREMTRKLCFP